jgi:hypothetical protein
MTRRRRLVIDEWYDRAYREGRADLNDGLGRLFDALARRIRTRRFVKTGEMPCVPDSSPPSPSRRCR